MFVILVVTRKRLWIAVLLQEKNNYSATKPVITRPPQKKKKVIWSKSLCTLCQKYTLDRNLNVFFPTEQHAVHLLSLAECLFQEWDDLPHLLRTHQLF